MGRGVFLLILANVLMTSFAQILLKAGMSTNNIQSTLDAGSMTRMFVNVFTNYQVVVGLTLYVGAAVVWLLVLARVEVSLAYPFVGLSFIVTMLLAWTFHNEALSIGKVAGTLIIALGIVILARGGN